MSAPAETGVRPIGIAEQPAFGLSFTAYPPGTSDARALCLEVPINVLGYHAVTETGGEILQREPFEEESITMVLLVRGAVIRLAAPVARGQNLMLLNRETQKYIHCRVVNIRSSPEVKKYVEVEFTHSAPTFWGVSFPKEAVMASLAETASRMPAVPPTKPTSEATLVVPRKAMAAAIGAAPSMASVVAPALTPELPMATPLGDWAPAQEPEESPSHQPFFLPLPTEGLPICEPVRKQVEDVSAPPAPIEWELPGKSVPRRRRGARQAIAATGLLCAMFVGYRVYWAAEDPTDAANLAVTLAAPASVSRGGDPGPVLESGPTMVRVTGAAPEVTPVEQTRRRDVLISNMAMPEHSMASDPQPAPEITVSAGEAAIPAALQLKGETAGATKGLFSAAGPEPPAAPENVVTPTSSLTPALLLSTVKPVYPQLAKQAHIEGNVIIDAQIDASGSVVGMKVLSGSQVLREAATTAVAKWKFQPARLGDQPTPTSLILTVRFTLR